MRSFSDEVRPLKSTVQTKTVLDISSYRKDAKNFYVNPNEKPLINVFTMGWMEDGRLGYPPDKKSYMQATPRQVHHP
jgi:hypothetical protein